jgi:hypothetical protein
MPRAWRHEDVRRAGSVSDRSTLGVGEGGTYTASRQGSSATSFANRDQEDWLADLFGVEVVSVKSDLSAPPAFLDLESAVAR